MSSPAKRSKPKAGEPVPAKKIVRTLNLPGTLRLDKANVAERQLSAAATMFFQSADPVSIHTLSSAALEVISAVAQHRQVPGDSLHEMLIERVRPEHQEELRSLLREPQNFFKHANRDVEERLDFHPDAAGWVLFDGIWIYRRVMQDLPVILRAFEAWWVLQHPHILRDDTARSVYQKAAGSFPASNRKAFLVIFSEAWARSLFAS